MAENAAVILALSFAWQSRWQELRQSGRLPAATNARTYTREDAVALGHHLGARFARNGSSRPKDHWLLRSVDSVASEIHRYEDPHFRERALDLIPFDDLNAQASTFMDEQHLAYQDALVQALVQWAKRDFLIWADPIKCSSCGGATEGIAGGTPTPEERGHGAGRVELYRCTNDSQACKGSITRFPRYSSLEKLLQTRTGRCGEFAAVFMLLLRALNIRARYIWNSEDHVWNEYYSDELQRWVHVDSCEGARDKNLLYDRGWGKKMRYCIAFGVDGAKDVTRSYVTNWQDTLARRDPLLEQALATKIASITAKLRQGRSQSELVNLQAEDVKEEQWLSDFQKREEIAAREILAGRTSGTKEWRAQRSELGGSTNVALPGLQAIKKIASLAESEGSIVCNGSAIMDTNRRVTLTADEPGQIGSAFLKIPAELQDFILNSTFRIRHKGAEGADGMAVVLHADPRGVQALGDGGCDLGYGGIKNCIAVEIDTYRSSDRCDDPPTPHISVHTAGKDAVSAHHKHSLWCTKPGTLPDLDDGREYSIRLEVSLSQDNMRIYFNDNLENDFVELTAEPIKIGSILGAGDKYLGWTAATGGLHQEHTVTSFDISQAEVQDVAAKDRPELPPNVATNTVAL